MKENMKKIIVFIILISCTISYNCVYAGFADYTDKDARKATEQLIQEQKQNYNATKSSNNYLKNLKVDDYEITPQFDKQIINYEIKEEIAADEIQIQAETDDENAIISGNDKITLNSGENNITIDVTAENGTVRSYYIKVIKTIKKELRLNSMKLEAASSENNVNNIELEPKFDSETFTYNCNVENYIDRINIDAKANNENANIAISGNENLKDGLNEILVTIKANNDDKIVYRIYVNKDKKEVVESKEDDKDTNNNDNNNIMVISGGIGIGLVLILILGKIRRKKK